MKTYNDIVSQLNQKPMMPTYIPSLDRIKAAIDEFFTDLAFYKQQMIVIAGTNGKGSTAKALESLLMTSGKDVCLYTSPHLIHINERFRKNGQQISNEEFSSHYTKVETLIAKWQLTHFEILTLVAVSYFKDSILNGAYCIWEVGMGGRWDATNAIPHTYNVLTTIGIDHQKYLGDSVEEIASNKFDIIHQNSITISGFLPSSTYPILKQKIQTESSQWLDLSTDIDFQNRFSHKTEDGLKDFMLHENKKWTLGLAGERGYQNILLALYVLNALKIEIQNPHLASLSEIRWPHRFSLLTNHLAPCPVYLSGDHNPEGIASLLEIVQRLQYAQIWLLVALTEGRDPELMLEPLTKIKNSKLVLTESPFKGLKIEDYKSMWKGFSRLQPECYPSLETGFRSICERAKPQDLILVTGSLYLTGKVDELFGISPQTIS